MSHDLVIAFSISVVHFMRYVYKVNSDWRLWLQDCQFLVHFGTLVVKWACLRLVCLKLNCFKWSRQRKEAAIWFVGCFRQWASGEHDKWGCTDPFLTDEWCAWSLSNSEGELLFHVFWTSTPCFRLKSLLLIGRKGGGSARAWWFLPLFLMLAYLGWGWEVCENRQHV